MNQNCRQQRPQYRSRLIVVVAEAFAGGWLGEHNVSRGHENGLSVVRDSGSECQLKLGTVSHPANTDNLRDYGFSGGWRAALPGCRGATCLPFLIFAMSSGRGETSTVA